MKVPSNAARRSRAPQPPLGVARQYRRALAAYLDELDAAFLPIILDGWDANPAHNPGTVPRTDAILSSYVVKRVGSLKLAVAHKFDPGTKLSQTIQTLAARVNKQGAIEFQRVIPIKTSDLGIGAALVAFRDRNVDLITSLVGTQIDEIRAKLIEAEAGAWRVEKLAAEIQDRFQVTKSKADLLARDQTLKLNGQLVQTRQTAAGITEYIWTTSDDERVRPDHHALDGTRQSWAVPPIVDEKSGRTGHPGDDYQCRCTPYPVLPELAA